MCGVINLKNFAIIPARQGSKGIPDKNIQLLCGKPLLTYTVEAAIEANLFDEIFVSTDSEQYAQIAREAGAKVPFLRDPKLATDTALSWDVARDAVEKYRSMGMDFDTIALLQPTSPLRNAHDILAGYLKMEEKEANLVVSVCETTHSPLWENTLPEDHTLNGFFNQNSLLSRQNLPKYYRVNGALYIIKTDTLMYSENIYSRKSFAVIMSVENSIDIDEKLDLYIAETILMHRSKN